MRPTDPKKTRLGAGSLGITHPLKIANPEKTRETKPAPDTVERAGAALVGLTPATQASFAALTAAVPTGAPNVLDLLDEARLPKDMRDHLASVQDLINRRAQELAVSTFTPATKQMSQEAGYSSKVVLDGRVGLHLSGHYLSKPLDAEKAAKVEFVTILANVLGLSSPLALRHEFPRADGQSRAQGVTIKLIDDVSESKSLYQDLPQLSPKVHEYLMVSRWFNDVIHNLDCWWKQFLVPKSPQHRHQELVQIDLDEAFDKISADKLHSILINHFHKDPSVIRVDSRISTKRDRTLTFDQPIGLQLNHLDSEYNVYGHLFRAYVTGEIDLDLEKIKGQVRFAGEVPRAAIQNAMQRWFKAAAEAPGSTPGYLTLPGTEAGKISFADFERLFTKRLERSIEEYCGLLDQLKTARENPADPVHRWYQNLPAPQQ